MGISADEIGEILRFIDSMGCEEVDVTVGELRVSVRRSSSPPIPAAGQDLGRVPSPGRGESQSAGHSLGPAEASGELSPSLDNKIQVDLPGLTDAFEEWASREDAAEVKIIRSPMVGTAYRAREPGAPPFVEVGDAVRADDVVCVVEVMKLFHSMTAGDEGVVAAIFIGDNSLVEYGQPLMAITRK